MRHRAIKTLPTQGTQSLLDQKKTHESIYTRIIYIENILDYYSDITIHTSSTKIIKIYWNSVVSTPGAKYYTENISNMYFMSLLPDPEYVRFKYDLIPPCIVAHYSLNVLVLDRYFHAWINQAWYRFKKKAEKFHMITSSNIYKNTVMSALGSPTGSLSSKHTISISH